MKSCQGETYRIATDKKTGYGLPVLHTQSFAFRTLCFILRSGSRTQKWVSCSKVGFFYSVYN